MGVPIARPDNIRTAWMVDVQVSNDTTLYFTTGPQDIIYNNNTYMANGPLRGVGRLSDNVRASDTTVGVTFLGIDIQFKQALLTANDVGLNGRPVNIYRVYFDDSWVVSGTPLLRYSGIIDSFTITDNYPTEIGSTDPISFNILISLRGIKDILINRVAGAFTNTASHQSLIDPTDICMDIVPSLYGVSSTLGGEPKENTAKTPLIAAAQQVLDSAGDNAA